jgi:hypothetical protein
VYWEIQTVSDELGDTAAGLQMSGMIAMKHVQD